MVTLIFRFDPRSGNVQVKNGQILKHKNFLLKHTYLVQFCLRNPKMPFFEVLQLEMPKNAIQKVTSSPLAGFWAIAHPAIKILA